MSELKKIILVFDDRTETAEGEEAKKWDRHSVTVATLAHVHGMNPFDADPVNWKVEKL